jgi:EAL domain-containing protein (putative c-di-GMP-specific phosphodiesterase class I)
MSLREAQRESDARCVVYEPSIEAATRQRTELEAEVRDAVEQGAFTLVLQPKACMNGRHVTGAEALIRWPHPQRGMLSPAAFLPVVEECGLMPALDRWVLRSALAQVQEMDRRGIAVPVSINLSVESLADAALVDNVRGALEEAGVAPELLEIEIPEGSLMRDVDTSARVLEGLNDLGVRISVDDFGTGYSSFAYLAHFPVHTLKVDRSFVIDMTRSEASRKIVAGLVRLAHSLSLRVVAEGAETRAQMAMLKRMHCDEMQGYGYARPMPFEEFCTFVAAHQDSTGPSAFTI